MGRNNGIAVESLVCAARSARPDYGELPRPLAAPEVPDGELRTVAAACLRALLASAGLDAARFGSPDWNPLGDVIRPGAYVVLKPNWVHHANGSGAGLDCLLTHPSLIEAVLEYVALARPSAVVVGDAPIQGCDFAQLRSACGLDRIEERFQARGLDLRIVDFRRTVLTSSHRAVDVRQRSDFVLVDLGRDSLLEPLRDDASRFRVTMYPPDAMRATHAPGRHQYLIARETLQADVVVNLPKLKSHKKAGITGALKNLVGINGNKEYLPHHRKGGSGGGGDCYPGNSWLKARAEDLLDAANRRDPGAVQSLLAGSAGLLARTALQLGDDTNLEGSWYGNDTVWRTCLDLQRILRYGTPEGGLAAQPQRTVLSITDAIVGGEGEGPLSPEPVPSGFLTFAGNVAAAEWVHARLMGFDPRAVPLVREAFSSFSFPLVSFDPSSVRLRIAGEEVPERFVVPLDGRPFRPSRGWRNHCELAGLNDAPPSLPSVVA